MNRLTIAETTVGMIDGVRVPLGTMLLSDEYPRANGEMATGPTGCLYLPDDTWVGVGSHVTIADSEWEVVDVVKQPRLRGTVTLERVAHTDSHPNGVLMSDLIGLLEVEKAADQFLRTLFLGASPVSRPERAAMLRPTDADYAAIFGPNAELVQSRYEKGLWTSDFLPEPKPGQTELEVYVADPALLAEPNAVSERFPGGYREIAHLLAPDTAWVAFRYHAPGVTSGMFYDGLVPRPGARWAWFPKPWRVLEPAD